MSCKNNHWIFRGVATFVCYVLLCAHAFAEPKVGVIVPELRAPFKVIFDGVGNGIDKKLNKRASRLVLDKNFDSQEVERWLQKKNISAVITLGVLGQKASMYVPNNIPVVMGGLLSAPSSSNKFPGVAMTPEPGALFKLLRQLDKKRKKIIVVYNPTKNQWLIDLAKQQAVKNNVNLVAYKASDIKQSAKIYNEIFSQNGIDDTALWLLQDSKVVDSRVVLPFILEKAWQKHMVVFSSALSHVKKGVLFSMYPNNEKHGEQLAALILKESKSSSSVGNTISPTKGLQDAVNSRTAEHLGLNLSRSELREFDVVFPLSN